MEEVGELDVTASRQARVLKNKVEALRRSLDELVAAGKTGRVRETSDDRSIALPIATQRFQTVSDEGERQVVIARVAAHQMVQSVADILALVDQLRREHIVMHSK